MKFLNAARQTPVVETLLPLSAAAPPGSDGGAPRPAAPVEYEFLPSARDILEEILPVSFKVRLFKCFLDAAVSEQIARRVAMKAATENADDMIKNADAAVQPRPAGADHQGDRRGHRRGGGTGITSPLAAQAGAGLNGLPLWI